MASAFVYTNCSNVMINWMTGNNTPAAIGTRYVSIWYGDPQGAGSEVTSTVTGSATRPSIAFAAAASGSASSNATVTFTTNASGTATVDHVALHTASTGTGNILASATVTSKNITPGDALSITSGNATVQIA
jgi:hypothetical protein